MEQLDSEVRRSVLHLIRISVGENLSANQCAGPLGLVANVSSTPR